MTRMASPMAASAAATLGGRPVAALRVSEADARERHHGVSHHSLTAYGRVAAHPADIPVPQLPGAFGEQVITEMCEKLLANTVIENYRIERQ